MTFGLKIYNDTNILQVDDTYINLQLKLKTQVTLVDNTPAGWGGGSNVWRTSRYVLDLSNYVDCVVAIKHASTSNTAIPLSGFRVGNSFYIDAYSKQPNILIDVFIFSFDGAQSFNSSYGLQVFNQDGKETFNSNKKYLRVVDAVNQDFNSLIQQDPITERSLATVTTVDTSNKVIAFCFLNTPFYDQKTYWEDADDFDLRGTDIVQTATAVTKTSSNSISLNYKRIVVYSYNMIPSSEWDRSAHSLSLLLVDVTNY